MSDLIKLFFGLTFLDNDECPSVRSTGQPTTTSALVAGCARGPTNEASKIASAPLRHPLPHSPTESTGSKSASVSTGRVNFKKPLPPPPPPPPHPPVHSKQVALNQGQNGQPVWSHGNQKQHPQRKQHQQQPQDKQHNSANQTASSRVASAAGASFVNHQHHPATSTGLSNISNGNASTVGASEAAAASAADTQKGQFFDLNAVAHGIVREAQRQQQWAAKMAEKRAAREREEERQRQREKEKAREEERRKEAEARRVEEEKRRQIELRREEDRRRRAVSNRILFFLGANDKFEIGFHALI